MVTTFSRALGLVMLTSALACGANAVDTGDEPTDVAESAYNDISGCYASGNATHEAALTAQGYTKTGTAKYEVVWYQFGSSSYWKEVEAQRYEKAGSVRYATCKGIVASPMRLGTGPITLTGKYHPYTCKHPCMPQNYGWQDGPGGTATVEPKELGLAQLGGGARLTVHVKAVHGTRKIDEDVILQQNGTSWSNTERMVWLDIVGEKIVAAKITTRPPSYDPYDPAGTKLNGRDQFRFQDANASTPSVKTVTFVDLPQASGVRAVPASLTFAPSEGSVVELVNASTFPLAFTPSMGTAGSFQPNERITLQVGLPSIIRVKPYPEGEIIVDLKLGQ
jgi:hypothetical protein